MYASVILVVATLLATPTIGMPPKKHAFGPTHEVTVYNLSEEERARAAELVVGIYTAATGREPENLFEIPFVGDNPNCPLTITTIAGAYPKSFIERQHNLREALEKEKRSTGIEWDSSEGRMRIRILESQIELLDGEKFENIGKEYTLVAIVPIKLLIVPVPPKK